MTITSTEALLNKLRDGEIVIVFDDVKTKIGTLVGIAERVVPEAVNLMTKIGKGLISVCITEEKANQLDLPLMNSKNTHDSHKLFTVSVDYKDTTTGISAFERSDTIKAFTDDFIQPDDFRRPGHVFPFLSKDKGLLQRIGIAEASVDLARMVSSIPIAYTCDILNEAGEISNKQEIMEIAKVHNLGMISLSRIIDLRSNELLTSFSGFVQRGREVGRKIGFPTANLQVDLKDPLKLGVYGVHVFYNEVKYFGVMNVGIRSTFEDGTKELHHEVHLLNFNSMIYGKNLKVDVNFFVRNEVSFSTIDQLISQIKEDIEYVKNRFELVEKEVKLSS